MHCCCHANHSVNIASRSTQSWPLYPPVLLSGLQLEGEHSVTSACLPDVLINNLKLLCRLVEDTAWHPVTKEELIEWKGTFKGGVFKAFLGSPLKSWASVGHWLIYHFDLKKYSQKQQDRVSLTVLV